MGSILQLILLGEDLIGWSTADGAMQLSGSSFPARVAVVRMGADGKRVGVVLVGR